jgi:hypothetical protein
MPELNHQPSYHGDNIEDILAGGDVDIDDLIADGYLDDEDLSPIEKEERRRDRKEYARLCNDERVLTTCIVEF